MATEHYTNGLVEDAEGWWPGRCECGWNGGMYPSAEDAADALMDHAYAEGYSVALANAVAMSPAAGSVGLAGQDTGT